MLNSLVETGVTKLKPVLTLARQKASWAAEGHYPAIHTEMMTAEVKANGKRNPAKHDECMQQFWSYDHVYWGAASADYDQDGWPDLVATATEVNKHSAPAGLSELCLSR